MKPDDDTRGPERCVWNALVKTRFPGLYFSRHGRIAASRSQKMAQGKNCTSEDQDLAVGYMLTKGFGSKTEIPDEVVKIYTREES
jgi:hypothetical protein